jgi:protein-tyrosine-phosphatase
MAEGYFNKYAPKGYEAISAGTKPVSQINPIAVQFMREADIDISKQKSKERRYDSQLLKYSKYGLYGKRIMSNSLLAEFA